MAVAAQKTGEVGKAAKTAPLKILLVEDSPGDRQLVEMALAEAGAWRFSIVSAEYFAQACALLAVQRFDAALLDLNLPDSRGLDSLTALIAAAPHMAVVVFTGEDDEDLALEAMRRGAQDYLVKGRCDGQLLSRTLRHAVERKHLMAENLRLAALPAHAEAQLRASEERYRLLAEYASDLIARIDSHGVFLDVSPACRDLLGWQPEELTGESAYKFLHPDDIGSAYRFHAQVMAGTQPQSLVYRQLCKDGSYVWFETTSKALPAKDGVVEIVGVSRDITRRRLAEAELEAARASLAEAQRIAHLGNWEMDLETDELWWSDEIYRIFGLRPQECGTSYATFLAVTHPDDREQVQQVVGRCRAEGGQYSCEYRVLRPDGSERIVHERGEVVLGASGAVQRMLGTVLDITERKRAERALQQANDELERRVRERTHALRDSEQRIRLITDAMPGLISYIGADLRFQFANRRHEDWFGLPPDQLIGRSVAEVYGQDEVDHHVQLVLAGEQISYDGQIFQPDGSPRHYHATHIPDRGEDGQILGYFSLIHDITERKRAEEALRRSEEKYRALMNDAADPILLAGPDGRIFEINRRAEEFLGHAAADLRRMTLFQLHAEEEQPRLREALAGLQRTGSVNLSDIAALRKDGRIVPVDIAASSIVFGSRRIVQTILKDISSHKRAEEQLRAAKEAAELADRAKTEFLANMSHELRTPLNAIIGFSDIMHNELLGPVGLPAYREYSKDINDSGRHLLEVINEILDMSKVESGHIEMHPESVRLPDLIQASLRLISERAMTARVRLAADLPAHLPLVYVDERRFKQILLNLLSNAVKFTPIGGEVKVRARQDDGGGLIVAVSDTGIGMSADDVEKALTPFGQVDSTLARKYDGTGLGLPLTKAFVELHDGELRIDSEKGRGTTVAIHLPPRRVLGFEAEIAL